VCGIGEIDAGPHDVVQCAAGFGERCTDDLEAAAHLLVRLRGRIRVGRHDRRRTGDEDPIAHDDRTAVPPAFLEG